MSKESVLSIADKEAIKIEKLIFHITSGHFKLNIVL